MSKRKETITIAVDELVAALGKPRIALPVDDSSLMRLYERKDHVGMLNAIRDHLKLPAQIRLETLEDGLAAYLGWKSTTPACIEMPRKIPPYGTDEFKRLIFNVKFRTSFLRSAPFASVVLVMAHELSHIVIESIGHKFAHKEEAVDLTAMILGYRGFYLCGGTYVRKPETIAEKIMVFMESKFLGIERYRRLGYLSTEEIVFANELIEQKAAQK